MTRELPHNFEAEQALLGSIIADNAAYHRVSEFLEAGYFADPLHGRLYATLGKLIERGQVVSGITLKTYVENDEDLKKVGGAGYLARMIGASLHVLDAEQMGRLIADAAARRQLITLANDALSTAYSPEPEDSAAAQVERLERGLYAVADGASDGGYQTFAQAITQSLVSAEAAHRRGGGLTGVGTGLEALDRLLGGLHKSDLTILAARPSMGKSALATNIGFNAALAYVTEDDGKGGRRTVDGASVAFFSLEMSAEQLVTRILAEQIGVPSERIRRGQLTNPEFDRLATTTKALERLPFFIDGTPALTIGAIRTRARRLKRQHNIGLVIVDYLQMVEAANRKDGRVQEVSEVSRGLKALAKELDVPVLALSQLSRAVENRPDKRPLLSDLRDSGTIEQDADVVMFIYREEYYLERGSDADRARLGDVAGKGELLIAKQRHGPTGMIELRFDGATTKFSDSPVERTRRAA